MKNRGNLFRHAENGQQATARVLIALNSHFKITYVGKIEGYIVVKLPFCNTFGELHWNSYEYFTLSDNGCEINVEPINNENRMRSIPSTSDKFTLTAETMAYRIWCAMTNQEIDYTYNDAPAVHIEAQTLEIV